MDIKMEREIKRALNKFCSVALINALLPFADNFYCKLFGLYDLNYTPEIFNEKRAFVTEATKHYVLKRLPKLIYQNKDKMYVLNKKMAKICTPNDLNLFFMGLINTMTSCTSSEAFEEAFKTQFNTQKKSFKEELAQNRSESLSEFDKNILKFTNFKK